LSPGPGEVGQGQGGLKVYHLWRQPQKIRTKIFFRVQTRVLFFWNFDWASL